MKFDEARWLQTIQQPDWYLELTAFNKKAARALGQDSDEHVNLRSQVRKFFEQQLLDGKVNLAKNGSSLDKEREPIDTIVIHHTGRANYPLDYMNAVQLLNVYVRAYSNRAIRAERHLQSQPIWSGHFLPNGKPSFLCYHWLMRMDGRFERLLNDNQIGWHSGNWDINKRSIAICLDNDYQLQDPTDEVLQKLAAHIKKNYGFIKPKRVIGHCEARKGTICPGGNFLDGWKPKLLSLLYE